VSRVLPPTRHTIGLFANEYFQAINYTGTEHSKQARENTPKTPKTFGQQFRCKNDAEWLKVENNEIRQTERLVKDLVACAKRTNGLKANTEGIIKQQLAN